MNIEQSSWGLVTAKMKEFALMWVENRPNGKSVVSMPNLQNAIKALRQANKRAERNAVRKGLVDSLKRQFRKALEAGKAVDAKTIYQNLTQALDKAASKNVIAANKASRTKSRLAAKLNLALKK